MGSRALRQWLTQPLRERRVAIDRHDAIATLLAGRPEALRDALRHAADVERIGARIALRQVRPRELAGLRATLVALPRCARRCLPTARSCSTCSARRSRRRTTPCACSVRSPTSRPRCCATAASSPPATTPSSTSCARSAATATRSSSSSRRRERAAHRHRDAARPVQPRARLLHRGRAVSGRASVPADYRRRQTMKNAERFITPELKAFEDKALSAGERALARERALYERAARRARSRTSRRSRRSRARSPRSTRSPRSPSRRGAPTGAGRASSSEPLHRDRARPPSGRRGAPAGGGHAFIANDCRLDARARMLVITGPNMGGKSTFMRQVALIVAARLDRLVRARGGVPARADRRDPHPHRRRRRPRQRAVDLHGRDDRSRGDRPLPRPSSRSC